MRNIIISSFLILSLIVGNSPSMSTVLSTEKRTIDLNINLVFIGYDEEILNTTIFTSLNGIYDFYPEVQKIVKNRLIIKPTIISLTSDYYNELLEYVKNIADFDATTSGLDVTKLEEDSIDPTDGIKSDIFYERSGIAINATLVQNYLWNHPPVVFDKNSWSYGLYFLNFSVLDEGTTEHWYDISEIDLDTYEKTESWFIGYEGLFDRPVAGWGGDGDVRIMFFDPSALEANWYFDFMNTEYYFSIVAGYNSYPLEDMEDYIADHETFQPNDNTLEDYLFNFTYDLLNNSIIAEPNFVFSPDIEDYYFEIAIIENITRSGLYTSDDLDFIVQSEKIQEAFNELLPFFNHHVNIHWYSLEDYPNIQARFDAATTIYPDYYEIDIVDETYLLGYIEDNLYYFVDDHRDGMKFPTIVFLMNGSVMAFDGFRFGGVSTGLDFQIIAYQFDRFMNTSVSPALPKTGITDTIIHEAGHSLGFPHPHHDKYWSGDYVDSVMSYYVVSSYFSKFEQDWIQSIFAQQLLLDYIFKYEDLGRAYLFTEPESVVIENQKYVNKINEAWTHLNQMNFTGTFELAKGLETDYQNLVTTLNASGIPESKRYFGFEPEILSDNGGQKSPFAILSIVIGLPVLYLLQKKKKSKV